MKTQQTVTKERISSGYLRHYSRAIFSDFLSLVIAKSGYLVTSLLSYMMSITVCVTAEALAIRYDWECVGE